MNNVNEVLENARQFIYHNARLLDRMRFEYFFGQGTKESVLAVLRAYQNVDGGFGNALEPDIRCPHSQPVPTEVALTILDEIDGYNREIVSGIARFMESATVEETGGIPRSFCSVNDYPHAPWWTTERDDAASMNPTGRMMGFLLKQDAVPFISHETWFRKTEQFVWERIEKVDTSDFHDVTQCITFLENHRDRERAGAYLAKVDEWLSHPGTIELDPHAQGYVHKVLDWAPSRDSYAGRFIGEADLERHLTALLQDQSEDGGWPISWPAVSSACELEWRGFITVERLKTLRSYGRL
ncbi:hypothetical protein M3650_21105 [Paenibacillus sp. MER TA 81-3]|uniref:hypothetical protein n=1 Tax=Paenibacillus sp. MER TA 81-3 TaxID=2939573 RepID=UPI00203C9C5C|nr:hypothetical protein [Paenibacillus sp. MER TA 81-3]MCM3341063.1 hypothetical protein [Paenibacillus sp. MER TA 81-3]